MPNYTTKYQFPSPKPTESADGPTGFQQLAQKVEDVLIAQLGKVLIADTAEIDLSGDGSTTALALKAALKGVRNGNWDVTGSIDAVGDVGGGSLTTPGVCKADAGFNAAVGDLVLGRQGTGIAAASRRVRLIQQIGTSATETRIYNSSGGAAAFSVYTDQVSKAILYLDDEGRLSVTFGGYNRPVPFAMESKRVTVDHSNAIIKTSSVNLTSGRFTTTPYVQLTVLDTSSFLVCALVTTDKNGVDFQTRYFLNTASSINFYVYVEALQMTPTAAPGREAPQAVPQEIEGGEAVVENVAVCHTAGCDNEGVEVVRHRPENAVVWCGPCGNLITDVR